MARRVLTHLRLKASRVFPSRPGDEALQDVTAARLSFPRRLRAHSAGRQTAAPLPTTGPSPRLWPWPGLRLEPLLCLRTVGCDVV